MKKLFSGIAALALCGSLYGQNISVTGGWQLKGATEDITNLAVFSSDCVDTVWIYNGGWKVYSANSSTLATLESSLGSSNIASSISSGSGFWVNGTETCTIDTNANVDITSGTITLNGLNYKTVTSPYTGKIWLDRNLGATQVCTAKDDTACYGDYYQWGRNSDGHEKSLESEISYTQADSIDNAGSAWISGEWDWITTDNYGTQRNINWSKTDGTSVCPSGFRVPTKNELENETTKASIPVTDPTAAFNSFLKLPSAGSRDHYNNQVGSQGTHGYIWTSEMVNADNDSYFLVFYDHGENNSDPTVTSKGAEINDYSPADGYSVRCIKD